MKYLSNPIVKTILTVVALGLCASSQVPALASLSTVFTSAGTFILGALHVDTKAKT